MTPRIGAAQRPAQGEVVCGDAYVVVERPPVTVVGVADGLGHGELAAEASQAFCAAVREHADASLDGLFHRAHGQLGGTRGVAGAVLHIDSEKHTLGFAAIGNIELRALSAEPIKPISVAGIVGQRLRKVKPYSFGLARGDVIVVYSDGVSTRFDMAMYARLAVDEMARAILEDHGKAHDDVTCVAIRYG